jgi:DeoR family transcriptional regulator, fructose operon transcriptional repressor
VIIFDQKSANKMSFQKRKRIILNILDKNGEADVKDLARQLEASEITIRRDLAQLGAEGWLERTHGGALKAGPAKPPVAFATKNTAQAEAKAYIGELAAGQVQEGEVIFMDCGSTVYQMCSYLRMKNIVVITNSLPVVHELMGTSVKINLIGGELDPQRQAVHGHRAEEHIRRYQADRAFVGADGVSVARGLSAGSEYEAGITLAMANQAHRTYLLCDESKLEQNRYLSFAPLSLVNTLVTNATGAQVLRYAECGVSILNGQ